MGLLQILIKKASCPYTTEFQNKTWQFKMAKTVKTAISTQQNLQISDFSHPIPSIESLSG